MFYFFQPLIKNSKTPYEILTPYFVKANDFANALGKEKFPRSISMIQYFIGIANELKYNSELGKYVPLITMEMETIFPEIKKIKKRFLIS